MGVTTTKTNKPYNPRAQDASPLAYNRAALYSGKALSFDGVNDSIDISAIDETIIQSAFSFHTIIKKENNATDNDRIIDITIDSNNAFNLITDNASQKYAVYLKIGGSNEVNQLTYSPIVFDELAAITFVWDGSSGAFYYNGQLVESTGSALIGFGTAGAFLGKRTDGVSSTFFNGLMSGVRVFNTALTAAQIADLYNFPEKIVPTGVDNTALKLWLPMMEGAGTTAYDGSGNGNHGTINGATYVNGIGAPVSQTSVIDWNKSYYFDGVDDSFTTGTYQALGDRTITLSFYSSDYSVTGSFPNTLFAFNTAGGGNTNIVRLNDAGYVAVYDGANQVGTPTISVNENELTHVAIVTDAGTETKVYVNGQLSYSTNAWSPTIGSTDIFNIGQEQDGGNISDLWRGFIFNVGVFDSILTQSEIQAIQGKRHEDLTSAQKTNLVSFYSLQNDLNDLQGSKNLTSTGGPNALLIPQGITTGRDLLGNLFENVRKQGALNLDGSSWAEVHDNASLDVTDAITLEAWVYWDGSNSSKGILGRWFSGNASYMLYANNSTTLYFFINTSSSAATISGTGWKHIVGTYDSIKRRVYIDGQEIGSGDAYNATIDVNDKPIEIGRYAGNTAYEYDGEIAQPRIYNRALSAEEIQRNYNAGKNIYS